MAEAGNLDIAPSQRPALDALIAALQGPQPPYVLLVSGTPLHPLCPAPTESLTVNPYNHQAHQASVPVHVHLHPLVCSFMR